MSVNLLSNKDISSLALFAQMHCIGSAALIGHVLHKQNLTAVNERYNETTQPSFELVVDGSVATPESIYDLARYLHNESWSRNFENSKAYNLILEIQSNAIFPKEGTQTFDSVIGRRIITGTYRETEAFITAVNGSSIKAVEYSRDYSRWNITTLYAGGFKPVKAEDNFFDLSIEQANGLLEQLTKRDNEAAEQRIRDCENKRLEQETFNTEFELRKPEGAKAVIIAEFEESECDSMSDYYGSKTTKRFILAWSKHTRNLFPELRKAARNNDATAFLFESDANAEHRENYSMGGGTYLSTGGRYSGWQIRKETIYDNSNISMAKWSLPETNTKTKKDKSPKQARKNDEITVLLDFSSHKLIKNISLSNLEIHFHDQPSEFMLSKLSCSQFKKSGKGSVWCANDSDESLVFARELINTSELVSFF